MNRVSVKMSSFFCVIMYSSGYSAVPVRAKCNLFHNKHTMSNAFLKSLETPF